MPKLKSIKHTKYQDKWIGPFTAIKVTDSHATISKNELNVKQDKKVPINLVNRYHERDTVFPHKRTRINIDESSIQNTHPEVCINSPSPPSSINNLLFSDSITPNCDSSSINFFHENLPELSNITSNTNTNDREEINYGFSDEVIGFHLNIFKENLLLTEIGLDNDIEEEEKKDSGMRKLYPKFFF